MYLNNHCSSRNKKKGFSQLIYFFIYLSFLSTSDILAFDIGKEKINEKVFGNSYTTTPLVSSKENLSRSRLENFVGGIGLVKTGSASDSAGVPSCATIQYTYTVTNESTENEALENIVVTDDVLGDIPGLPAGDVGNDGILSVGEIWVFDAEYNITQTDIDNGQVESSATVQANVVGDAANIVSDISDDESVLENDPTIINIEECQPNIGLIKTGEALDFAGSPGCEIIQYTFTLTNEGGGQILENIVLTDPLLGADPILGPNSGDDNNDTFLDPDEIWIYTENYIITQPDITSGEVENQATVTADVQGQPGDSVSDLSDDNSILEDDPTIVDLSACQPNIGLIKTGELGVNADGSLGCEVINYTFTLTNEGGGQVLENIVLIDPLLGGIIPGPDSGDDNNNTFLDPGETWIYSASYDITQADLNIGEVENQATVTADVQGQPGESVSDDSDDNSVLEDDPTIVDLSDCQEPNIGLIKTGELVDVDADGCIDSILYTFTVTNTGNVDLEEIVLKDVPLFGDIEIFGPLQGTDVGEDGILSVGETWTYQALYGITQEDIDNTIVVNQATVTGFLLDSDASVSDLSDDDSLFEDSPTRTEVPDDACPNGSADIGLIKEGELVDVDADGCIDSILYTFTVTNTGDVDLEEIFLEDELLGGEVSGPIEDTDVNNDGILSVGETWTYQAIYGITQEDINNTIVVNQAQVNGFPIGFDAAVSDLSDDDSLFEDSPTRTEVPDDACPNGSADIGLLKTGELVDVDADGCIDSILYTFTVTNTGDVDLEEIFLEDELLGGEVLGPIEGTDVDNDGILSVGETWTYQATYGIKQPDIDNGIVVNQAQVTGFPIGFDAAVFDLSDDDSFFQDNPLRTEVPDDACTEGSANIALIKEGELVDIDTDGCIDSILYTFTVTNNGDVNLEEIFLEDELLGGEVPGPIEGTDVGNDGTLSVGETWTYQALYGITQEDIDFGSVVNQALVTGAPVGFDVVVFDFSDNNNFFDNNPTRIIVPDDACPNSSVPIALIKEAIVLDLNNDGCDDTIRYDFRVFNGGSASLENVVIIDELLGGEVGGLVIDNESEDGILAAGEEWTYSVLYDVTQDDIDSIFVENQARVTASIVDFDVLVFDDSDDDSYSEDDPTIVDVTGFCADGGGDFEIFNGITPNGDGFNDYFQIVGIENYPNNNVKIFNRWGVKVYETDNYGQGNNLFRGISEGRNTIAQDRELPSGTYFYTLTFPAENPGEESYNGYLYINRD